MFRKMRRAKQEIAAEECREILKTAGRAVLSLKGDGAYPYGVPVNFVYSEDENTIYIHGAKEGHKIDAIRADNKVCFTVWQEDYKSEGDWAWHLKSVIAFGKAELVEDRALTEEKVRELGLKFYPSEDEVEKEIQSAIDHVQLIAVHIEHMTGKEIYEK